MTTIPLDKELEKEQNRIQNVMQKCKCKQGISFELGKCNSHDVLYAKQEGISFAGELMKQAIQKTLKEVKTIISGRCYQENIPDNFWIEDIVVAFKKHLGGLAE